VASAIEAGVSLEALYVTDPTDTLAHGIRHVSLVDPDLLAEMATTQTPQGVVAVARWRPSPELPPDPLRVLVLCSISDPGNAGTLIRTAAGLGWDTVVTTRGSCDPTNPKVLRASAGAAFAVTVVAGAEAEGVLDSCRSVGLRTIAAATRGGVDPSGHIEAGGPLALWLGSEAHGMDAPFAAAMDMSVSIPVASGVESLNVAAAGAVLLWELRPRA